MKKKKLSFLLNIATICLAITAIAIGVYSAKQASLNIGGSLGFTAHNCNVLITPYVTGYNGVDESSTKQDKAPQTAVELGGTDGKSSKDLTLTSLNFNDLKDDGDTIVIDLEIENKSDFAVQVTIGMPTLKRSDNTTEIAESVVTKVVTNGSNTLTSANNKVTLKDKTNTTEKTTTITITLKVVDIKSTAEEVLKNAKISMSLSFEKYIVPVSYLATNWKYLISTSDGGSGFCGLYYIESIEFTNVKPVNISSREILIGVNGINQDRTSTTVLSSDVSEIYAYGTENSSGNYDIIIFSPGKIYLSDNSYILSAGEFQSCVGHQFELISGSKLKTLKLDNLDTSKVTNMSEIFNINSSLTSLDLLNFDTSHVTNMASMFSSCSALTSLDLSNFNTANVTSMASMFYDCSGLTSLDLTNFNTSKVTDMDSMFSSCSGLTSLDVTNFDTSNVTDMSSMFFKCNGLTSLDLSSFNTGKVTDMQSMFYNCSGLKTVYIGSGWNTSAVTSSTVMFSGCTSLPNYSASNVDVTYAKIISEGGYLTAK